MGLMTMLRRTVVGALLAGALVVLVAVPGAAAAAGTSNAPTTCHDTQGGPGGGCPLGVLGH